MRKRSPFLLAALSAALALPSPAPAQDFPNRTIQFIVPFGPGFVDVVARALGEQMAADLGKPVIIVNRPGAAGSVGAAQVAKADPDGYTLLLGGLASNIMAPAINANISYDGIRDFTQIAYIGGPAIALVVPGDSPIKNLKDLAETAKAGKLAGYASSGVGTTGNIVMEILGQRLGFRIPHVPYNSAAMTDIITGRVPVAAYTYTSTLGLVQGGQLRAIAVTGEKRGREMPDVQTLREQGIDLAALSWLALLGPRGIPQPVVARLEAAAVKAMKSATVIKHFEINGIETRDIPAKGLAAHFEAEARIWVPAAKAAVPAAPK